MSPIDTAPIDAAAARSELIPAPSRRRPRPTPARSATAAAASPTSSIRGWSRPRWRPRDYPETTLAAALLHDVVEDSDTTVEELRAGFGDEVAELVAALSDDESIEDYRARKDEHRGRVAEVDGDALAIYAADKLTNMTTLGGGDRGRRHRGSPTSSRCRSS